MISVQCDGAEKQMFQKLCSTNQLKPRDMFEFLVYKGIQPQQQGNKKDRMKYHELNHTTPLNYRPDDDSAKFFLPEDKVDKFRRLWKKHNRKQKQTKKEDDFTAPEPISVAHQNDNSNLIIVGGLVGESNLDQYKTTNVAKQIWTGATMLNEDAASFVVFRSDTNQVLARGVWLGV